MQGILKLWERFGNEIGMLSCAVVVLSRNSVFRGTICLQKQRSRDINQVPLLYFWCQEISQSYMPELNRQFGLGYLRPLTSLLFTVKCVGAHLRMPRANVSCSSQTPPPSGVSSSSAMSIQPWSNVKVRALSAGSWIRTMRGVTLPACSTT